MLNSALINNKFSFSSHNSMFNSCCMTKSNKTLVYLVMLMSGDLPHFFLKTGINTSLFSFMIFVVALGYIILIHSLMFFVFLKTLLLWLTISYTPQLRSCYLIQEENMSHWFQNFLKDKNNKTQQSCPYSHQQNEIIEWKNRNIHAAVGALFIDSFIQTIFFG
eukprot:TRINITY_DN37912_c1_g1_i1.p1 TRINITY_DN37912_c1_g1~~TRINITY_DN37912_c1_g1_i1.p1  ORF type:complete len:163 (+),score=4.58 TRINITY_DN37912_c1_g1_i1:738-1226(+)